MGRALELQLLACVGTVSASLSCDALDGCSVCAAARKVASGRAAAVISGRGPTRASSDTVCVAPDPVSSMEVASRRAVAVLPFALPDRVPRCDRNSAERGEDGVALLRGASDLDRLDAAPVAPLHFCGGDFGLRVCGGIRAYLAKNSLCKSFHQFAIVII